MSLPRGIAVVLNMFCTLFTLPTWQHVRVLLTGAILCQGARRVSSTLRVLGLEKERRFEKYHRVFNRSRWNSVMGAKILMGLLIQLLPDSFPTLIVVDDTIERRKGKKITAKGCYRDACRSTEKAVIKCFGLKWVCFMLIVPLPWCKRPWALPFMTILAASKKHNEKRNRPHKTSIDWRILAAKAISRWMKRAWILIGDGAFACIRLGHACNKKNVTLISRLRLDSSLYEYAPTPIKGQRGRHRKKGERFTSLKKLADDTTQLWQEITVNWYGGETKILRILTGTHLWYSSGEKPLPIRWVLTIDPNTNKAETFFTTNLQLEAIQVINWFILRWNIEVTFEEVRAHLGMETQRQWSQKAIARTTPTLMALFSLTCLFALEMLKTKSLPLQSTTWYDKKGDAAFSDIIAFVRRSIWAKKYFDDSASDAEYMKIRRSEWESLMDQLSRAA